MSLPRSVDSPGNDRRLLAMHPILRLLDLAGFQDRGQWNAVQKHEVLRWWDSYWDIDELVGSLPYIKITTGVMVAGFAILHLSSGYVGGGKYWLARRHPLAWGVICGMMVFLCMVMRPSEAVDFIYFRF